MHQVDLLKGIKNDAVQEDTKEKAQWAKVSTWYTHFKLAQDKSIEELETLIETEEGIADSSGAQAAGLTEDINEKTQENSEYEQKKKEQTAELETKTAHCAKQSHDYQESIDALKNAVEEKIDERFCFVFECFARCEILVRFFLHPGACLLEIPKFSF